MIVYPILWYLERKDFYSDIFQPREDKGEIKNSLLILFVMGTVVTVVFRGIFGSKLTVLAAVPAWGIGDAVAALVGQNFGKHKIPWRISDGKKTFEGSDTVTVPLAAAILFQICLWI